MAAQNSFLINSWNHGRNPNSATDVFRYLRNGLSLAGQTVGVSPTLFHNADLVNILVENFNIKTAENIISIKKNAGIRFVLVATELLTGSSFNDVGSDQSNTTYADLNYWQERYTAFAMLAEYAEAIWLMSEYQRPGYAKNFPNTQILTLPMCFDSIEAANGGTFRAPKLYDAVFMGTHTSIRIEMLEELKKRVQLYTPHNVPPFMVSSVIQSAQVFLHLHLKEGWPFTSMMRHHVALTYGAYVISEKSELPGELDGFVEIVPRGSFADVVQERVLDKSIVPRAREMQRQYAAKGDLGAEFRVLVDAMPSP
ncbi:MAG: hypothetical protein WD767_01640 [Alphaproteobacteria bacterium]